MMNTMNIDTWQVAKMNCSFPDHTIPAGDFNWIKASVPGAVQYDLINAGDLKNPYESTEAAFDSAWVAKNDWLYKAVFDVSEAILKRKKIFLKINGIDTFSEIWLNEKCIGDTANAYRVYNFTINTDDLKEKGNILFIRVKSHERMIADKIENAKCLGHDPAVEGTLGKSLIRRYQRSFFSASSLLNLGTGVLGIGIHRKVELISYSGAYLADCFFRTTFLKEDKAEGLLFLQLENQAAQDMRISVQIKDEKGDISFTTESLLQKGEIKIPVIIENPQLWWPKGYGKSSLYDLTVRVYQGEDEVDLIKQQIGLRTVSLITKIPPKRPTFYFNINGKKILIHGQNHIPLDYIKTYGNEDEYRRLFQLYENQNVNLIRIWGGGAVENSEFYTYCDRNGILIWQEMFLHSNTYPDYDPDFVQDFIEEAKGIIQQVRMHPCLCIICGGNEQQEGWEEWGWQQSLDKFYGEKLIQEYLPSLAEKMCPDLPYIFNSPHGGKWAQSPVEGECHNWGNFYNSTKDPLFVTETCWTSESYSRPETLKKYMNLNVDEYTGKGWGERWKNTTSLSLFNARPYSNWCDVSSLRNYLFALELEQMRADYHALNMFRYRSPSNSGIVYWSMNKGGPLFQFGCIDYGGYPMMSYYAVKRVFSSIGVHAYRDINDIKIMLSNHSAQEIEVQVTAVHLNTKGDVLDSKTMHVKTQCGELVHAMRFENLYEKVIDRTKELIYVYAMCNEEFVSDDMLFFCPFSEFDGIYEPLNLQTNQIKENSWRITISAKTPVQMILIESNHKILCSDNYFSIIPQMERTVDISVLEKTVDEPLELFFNILGCDDKQKLILT